ncbi:MAG: tRNA preQ1(34) S-adenosylmethionine ribosyltransferase-isomerase QueA [Ruminococcus sp.]|jgi:S-adenosylmethionine:tRNA ribosyltransferase-isomerase|nr:tRNA preQ1(34) S-adenosylmethionine ribosyltransferase-isomerase QueA [Ruminococcus sp.]
MKKNLFNYNLPPELIAQNPAEKRSESRLMVCKDDGKIIHDRFYNIKNYLNENDLLILNNTKVLPARLLSSELEILLLTQVDKDIWECIGKPGKKMKIGRKFSFTDELTAEILDISQDGKRLVKFTYDGNFYEVLDKVGVMPLPPYITEKLSDNSRYQTVYAEKEGSAAAPTAGLHFTKDLLEMLNTAYITLNIGLGTFRPVKTEDIKDHIMHSESYYIPPETAAKINSCKGRIISVGTTSARTLESCFQKHGKIISCTESTDIFIYPGYEFKVIEGLVTNFHLPESTLIMLVCAFYGYDRTMAAYAEAVREKYRFFSFGDAMLLI